MFLLFPTGSNKCDLVNIGLMALYIHVTKTTDTTAFTEVVTALSFAKTEAIC